MIRTRCGPEILVLPGRTLNHLFNRNRDRARNYGRIVRNMQVVAQQQAQGVLAGREVQRGRGGRVAEVNMVRICRDRHPHVRQISVDEQMMMSRMGLFDTGSDDAHTFDSELDCDRIGHGVAILWCYEKYAGAGGRSGT
jgi:hypothetical protein